MEGDWDAKLYTCTTNPGQPKGVVTKPDELTEVARNRVAHQSGVEGPNILCGFPRRKIIHDFGLPCDIDSAD